MLLVLRLRRDKEQASVASFCWRVVFAKDEIDATAALATRRKMADMMNSLKVIEVSIVSTFMIFKNVVRFALMLFGLLFLCVCVFLVAFV